MELLVSLALMKSKIIYTSFLKQKNINTTLFLEILILKKSNWHNNTSNDNLQSSYVNLFADLGVLQQILEPTHRCGNTLDLLLSDTPDIVHDIMVHHPGSFINSDHSPLTFGIRTFIKRKKASKRSIYYYKKATWKDLNRDLNRVDWHLIINNEEPDTSWNIFRTKFLLLCDKHVP